MKKKFLRIVKRIMITTFIIIAVVVTATLLYMQQDKFGKSPGGERLEKMKQSPNFKNGKFQNLSTTTTLAEGHSWFKVLYQAYIKNKPRQYPTDTIPSVKTDLLNLPADKDVLVWFGHSSYLAVMLLRFREQLNHLTVQMFIRLPTYPKSIICLFPTTITTTWITKQQLP